MNAKTPKTLTYAETESLLDWVYTKSLQGRPRRERTRNYTIALLMLDAGLRVSEACSLRQNQLLFDGKPVSTLLIPTLKIENHPERRIPVTHRLSTSLNNMSNEWWTTMWQDPANYAFYMDDRRIPINVRYIQRFIGDAAYRSIGYPINPHMLRHTFATRLMRITNIRVVQELLGHGNLQSTQIYTHPNSDDLEKAIQGLNGRET